MRTGTYVNHTRTRRMAQGKDYIRVCRGPERDEYVHTLVAEAMLGRKLRPSEVVDHRDSNGLNPAPWNLRVVTRMGNSRKLSGPLENEVIFDGAVYWQENNPGWVDPVEGGVYVKSNDTAEEKPSIRKSGPQAAAPHIQEERL